MAPKYGFAAREVLAKGKVTEEALKQMKSWCEEADLMLTDEQIVLFLHCCKNQVCGAQKVILRYFKCRAKAPDIFCSLDMDIQDMKKAAKVLDIAVMPHRTHRNEIVLFARLSDFNFQNFHLDQFVKLVLMGVDLALRKGPSDGIVAVTDMRGAGLLHLTRIRIGVVQRFFQYVQEGLPCPIKRVHVLNTVSFIDKILLLIKPFMQKELYDAIVFHPSCANVEQVLANIPKKCLPSDYTGSLEDAGTLANDTYAKMKKLRPFYAELETQVSGYNQ